jgi:hypothetical protein
MSSGDYLKCDGMKLMLCKDCIHDHCQLCVGCKEGYPPKNFKDKHIFKSEYKELQKENERLEKKVVYLTSFLWKYDQATEDIQQLKEALRKCNPSDHWRTCKFCNCHIADHKDDCEYIKLTK